MHIILAGLTPVIATAQSGRRTACDHCRGLSV